MYPNYYQSQNLLKGRPVSSIEEARAANVDFDGSISYFPDLANKRIYTKQINLDGTLTMLMYEIKDIVPEENKYLTREEFEEFIKTLQIPREKVEL